MKLWISLVIISYFSNAFALEGNQDETKSNYKRNVKAPKPENTQTQPNPSVAYVLKNVISDLCLEPNDRLVFNTTFKLTKCPKKEEMKTVEEMAQLETPALILMEPFATNVTIGSAFKGQNETELTCGYTGMMADGSSPPAIWALTDFCADFHNPWHRFDLLWTDGEKQVQFFVRHQITKRCLRPHESKDRSPILAFSSCDLNDPLFMWTREIWPISDNVKSTLNSIPRSVKMYK